MQRRHDDTRANGTSNDTGKDNNDDESDTGNQSACNTAKSDTISATWNAASGVDNREDGANTVVSVDDKEREAALSVRIGRESDE